ncbi:MAG: YggS family pyridoxal phosphate-dependent enzyme [Candidatus Omnitrophota bacterium]
MIKDNIEDIRCRINAAIAKANRSIDDIAVVAVTKTVQPDKIREAIGCGITDIGENKVQEATLKYNEIPKQVRWHMVGHLQSNKAKAAVEIFEMIHSLDSLHLAEAIDAQARKLDKTQKVLVQVNASGEEEKSGVAPEDLDSLLKEIDELKNISVTGLMTMAPIADNKEKARPYFRILRDLFESAKKKGYKRIKMQHLSMGMSEDFETALEEGANMVRIGRAIFK